MDQVLQQTINKDEESKLGVIGLTEKSALTRWLNARCVTAEYVESYRSLSEDTKQNTNTKNWGRDEKIYGEMFER